MDVYLQTRGVVGDYDFVGPKPPESWWRKDIYAKGTSFEKPSVIVECEPDGGWRCYIGGVPSTRKDRSNTKIRYTLVLAGVQAEIPELLIVIREALLAFEPRKLPNEFRLTQLLDGIFDDAFAKQFDAQRPLDYTNSLTVLPQKLAVLQAPQQVLEPWGKTINASANAKGRKAVAFLNLAQSQDYAQEVLAPMFESQTTDLDELALFHLSPPHAPVTVLRTHGGVGAPCEPAPSASTSMMPSNEMPEVSSQAGNVATSSPDAGENSEKDRSMVIAAVVAALALAGGGLVMVSGSDQAELSTLPMQASGAMQPSAAVASEPLVSASAATAASAASIR